MESFEGLEQVTWNPLNAFGIDYPFAELNVDTIYNTWLVLGILTVLLVGCRLCLRNKKLVLYYLITTAIGSFMDLVSQTMGSFIYRYFVLIFSLFTFILFCNWITLLPWTMEPTKDINTTLALGLISFFYKEIESIRTRGFKLYCKEFLEPFSIMFPINIIGHFSKIISISFRLFGNIFGGSVIMELYQHALETSWLAQMGGLFSGVNFVILLFFGVFEGLIQAFVFAMLTLTYLTLAVYDEHAGEV
jgi:F-type H+-transporting ATPase subunit a